ncbi:hypothetical protein D3C79_1016360 [compost metagenome]
MNEGLNEQPADGADAELVALGEVELTATIEVHEECVVGGALRARPVVAVLREHLGAAHPAVVQLGCGRQVEVMVTVCLVFSAGIG